MTQIIQKARVTAGALNMRTSPGGDILKVLSRNTRVEVIRRNGAWFNVREGGIDGYVSSRFIKLEPVVESEPLPGKLATVKASRLNLRVSPRGKVVAVLSQGAQLQVLADKANWLQVRYEDKQGFVSRKFVDWTPDLQAIRQQIEDEQDFRFEGKKVFAPDGKRFATKYKRGVFNVGQTSIVNFISTNRDRFSRLSDSVLSVMSAVSLNEGKYESVNTWDNAFLSAGIFQWTAGTGGEAGELPAVLHRLQLTYPDTYEKYFGQYGLQPVGIRERKGVAPRGYFELDNELLANAAKKAALRTIVWAYRFWLAGQDDNVREIQTRHAIDRINLFYHQDNRRIGEFYVSDYVTSEYGVALLLDQHVNRPGHVPRILANAVKDLGGELDISDPGNWGDDEEKRLLEEYLVLRATTSMTHAEQRAATVAKQVELGVISDKRHSFMA